MEGFEFLHVLFAPSVELQASCLSLEQTAERAPSPLGGQNEGPCTNDVWAGREGCPKCNQEKGEYEDLILTKGEESKTHKFKICHLCTTPK